MKTVWLTLAALALTACGTLPVPLHSSSKAAAELRAAPETLTVDGQTLHLQADAWISTSQGLNADQFVVLIKIVNLAGTVPVGVVPQKLYLVRGAEVWESGFTGEYRGPTASPSEQVARTSPFLTSGTTLNIAADVLTPSGLQTVRVAGEQVVALPQ